MICNQLRLASPFLLLEHVGCASMPLNVVNPQKMEILQKPAKHYSLPLLPPCHLAALLKCEWCCVNPFAQSSWKLIWAESNQIPKISWNTWDVPWVAIVVLWGLLIRNQVHGPLNPLKIMFHHGSCCLMHEWPRLVFCFPSRMCPLRVDLITHF